MLLTRILSALVMGVVLAIALFGVGEQGWALAMLVLTGIAAWEWGALSGLGRAGRGVATALIVAACVIVDYACQLPSGGFDRSRVMLLMGVAALFWGGLVPWWLWRLPQGAPRLMLIAMAAPALVPAWLATVVLRFQGAGWLL